MHRRAVLAAGLIVGLVLPGPAPATGEGPAATTTVSDVRALRLESGMTAGVALTVSHEALADLPGGTGLPTARLDREDHPEALDGLWADGGASAAWLAPRGEWQFNSRARFVEALYVDPTLHSTGSLAAGDWAQTALVANAANATVPWGVQRGEPTGRLEWDAAVRHESLEASYSGQTGTLDVVQFRADVVARGGDVDARGDGVTTDWLTIDLPQPYPSDPARNYAISVESPFTRYIASLDWLPVPEAGVALLRAHVRGWIPEAREERLAGRVDDGYWHLPIRGTLALNPDDCGVVDHCGLYGLVDPPLAPQVQTTLPRGGTVHVGVDGVAEQLDVEPGETVRAGADGAVVVPSDDSRPDSEALGTGSHTGAERQAAAAIDHQLAEPVTLTAARGRYQLTVDPDFAGQSLLALRDVRHALSGARYADTIAVPAAIVDGQPMLLDRDRLVELRVVPERFQASRGGVRHSNSHTPVWTGHHMAVDGLVAHAVYDLDEGRYLRLHVRTPTSLSFTPPSADPTEMTIEVEAWSLDRRDIDVHPVVLVELPEAGPVDDGADTYTHEFAAQLPVGWLRAGANRVRPSWRFEQGTVTVLRRPAPLFAAPDPDRSLDGPVALVYVTDVEASPAPATTAELELTVDPPQVPEPEADPPPLGQACGTPQVQGGPTNATIRSGWLDADAANLYATLELANLPDAAPPGTTLDWAFYWTFGTRTSSAFATLGADGSWSFRAAAAPASGEVDLERGLIRVTIPRSAVGALDGELLRDTSMFVWLTDPLLPQLIGSRQQLESAPSGSSWISGKGGDYAVGSCGEVS